NGHWVRHAWVRRPDAWSHAWPHFAARAEGAALRAQSEAHNLPFPERWPVSGGYVRPEAAAGQVQPSADAHREPEDGAQYRQTAAVAIRIPQTRPERNRSK